MLRAFERRGFEAFREEWRSLDALGDARRECFSRRAPSRVSRAAWMRTAALLLEMGGQLEKFISGEASLRLIEGEA